MTLKKNTIEMPEYNEPKIIILHCAATPDHLDSKHSKIDFDVEDIRKWHINNNKWADVGYHYVIKRDGTIQMGRLETTVGSHVKGHNKGSLGICLIGTKEFTDAQFKSLDKLYIDLYIRHGIDSRDVYGHYEFADKECPNLDMNKMRLRFLNITKGLETSEGLNS